MADTLRRYLDSSATTLKQRAYSGPADLAARLLSQNPRLGAARAQFLAEATGQALPGGGYAWPFDPGFARSWPSLHTLDEWRDCWQRSTAPILCLLASAQRPEAATGDPLSLRERASCFRNLTLRTVADTGHNLHFDAPDAVAQAVEAFLAEADSVQ